MGTAPVGCDYVRAAGWLRDRHSSALVIFGLGATLIFAPLAETMMASVPVEHAGVGSASNTAISDVGPQLAVAVLFVVVTAHFYDALADV